MALKDKLAVAAALATMASTANAQKVQPDSKNNKPKTEKVTKAKPKTVTKAKTAEVEIPEEEIQTTEEVNQSITQVVSTYPTSVQYSVPAPDKIALDHSHMEVSKAYLGYVKGMMNKAIEKEGSLEIYNLYKGEGGRTVSTVITKGNYDGVYNTSSYIGDPTDASAGKIDIHGEGKYGTPELGMTLRDNGRTFNENCNMRDMTGKDQEAAMARFLKIAQTLERRGYGEKGKAEMFHDAVKAKQSVQGGSKEAFALGLSDPNEMSSGYSKDVMNNAKEYLAAHPEKKKGGTLEWNDAIKQAKQGRILAQKAER